MTTFLQDEIGRVPGASVIPTDTAAILAANPAWTLAGDVWETVTTEDMTVLEWVGDAPLTPRMQYALTIDVNVSVDASVRWLVHQTYYDGGTLTLADGAANIDPTTPVTAGAWTATARAWNAPEGIESGHFTTEVTAPIGTLIQLRAPFAAPLDGPLQIRAGAISAETIEGGAFTGETFTGGEFIGGEFRTSDTLPGQVTLADDAVGGGPGIRIDPIDATGITTPPGVSPSMNGMVVSGGVSTEGRTSFARLTPSYTLIRQSSTDETGPATWIRVEDGALSMHTVPDVATPTVNRSGISVADGVINIVSSPGTGSVAAVNANHVNSRLYYKSATGAVGIMATGLLGTYMEYTEPNGDSRRLSIDADGAWVEATEGGVTKKFNLVGTTWTPLALLNGWAPYTGGGGYYNGLRAQRTPLGIRVDGMVGGGTAYGVVAVLPDDMQDVAAKRFFGPVNGNSLGSLAIHRDPGNGNKFVISYIGGPTSGIISLAISTDAALL